MSEIACLKRTNTGKNGIVVSSERVYSFPIHAHAYYEMTLYAPFQGRVVVNQQELPMNEGRSVILMTPLDFHLIDVRSGEGARFIKVAFEEEALAPAARAALAAPLYLQRIPPNALLCQLFEELYRYRDAADYAAALIGAILLYLARHGQRLNQGLQDQRQALALEAARWLHAHFTEPVTMAGAARALSVSPQYLSGVFSRVMGVTLMDYVIALRLRRAAELLRESDQRVTEICFSCGYRNLSHFLRSFKRQYGASPRKFRERQGGDMAGGGSLEAKAPPPAPSQESRLGRKGKEEIG